MVTDINKIVGAKVVGVTKMNDIIFDNGITMTVHEYETYIVKHGSEGYSRDDMEYYLPSVFK